MRWVEPGFDIIMLRERLDRSWVVDGDGRRKSPVSLMASFVWTGGHQRSKITASDFKETKINNEL